MYSELDFGIVSDYIPDVIMGQLAAEFIKNGETAETADEIFEIILPDLKYRVFTALSKCMSSIDAFAWMYCTAIYLYKDDEKTECKIASFEDYQRMIQEAYEDITECDMSELSHNEQAGFDYLCGWMM